MVAVYDNSQDQWWLYYIETDGSFQIIKGPKDGQVEDSSKNPPYERSVPKVEATNIPKPRPGNPQIGVCEYIDNSGKPQVWHVSHVDFLSNTDTIAKTRVYYLDAKNRLSEMCWNAENGWFRGSLNSQEYLAASNSVLTTAVTKEQLKVYYRGMDDDDGNARLFVAWVTRGEQTWSRRAVMTF